MPATLEHTLTEIHAAAMRFYGDDWLTPETIARNAEVREAARSLSCAAIGTPYS